MCVGYGCSSFVLGTGLGFGVDFLDSNVPPRDCEGAGARLDTVNLKPDESTRVRCVTLRRDRGGHDLVPVDPGRHLVALGHHAEVIPLPALDEGMVSDLVIRC